MFDCRRNKDLSGADPKTSPLHLLTKRSVNG
jgi:hypothetical protein